MIVKLVLENFMAHGRTELELAQGLNVLCGPNNTGKSAVVEALRCLASNPSMRHVIRHGQTEARVEAFLEDGWRVAWVRRKAYALYEIYPPGQDAPQVFAKLGKGGVPDEVARLLRLGPVELEKDETLDIHLGDQRRPIFLLDRPGSTMAEFLASSTESAHLMAMQDALRDKVRKAKSDQRRANDAQSRARAGLDRLAGLPDVSMALANLGEEASALQARAGAEPALEGLVDRLDRLGRDLAQARRRAGVLSGLAAPAPARPAGDLSSLLESLGRTGREHAAVRARLDSLRPLAGPPELSDAPALSRLVREQGRLAALRGHVKARLDALDALAPPPAATSPESLARLCRDMAQARARLADKRLEAARLDRELGETAERVAARLKEVGACPLCGSDMDPQRFFDRQGGHGAAQD